MIGKYTEYLTIDIMNEYRKFMKKYQYDDRYMFVVLNADNTKLFRWMTDFNLGRFDTPSVFAFKDFEGKIFYRNYE